MSDDDAKSILKVHILNTILTAASGYFMRFCHVSYISQRVRRAM